MKIEDIKRLYPAMPRDDAKTKAIGILLRRIRFLEKNNAKLRAENEEYIDLNAELCVQMGPELEAGE